MKKPLAKRHVKGMLDVMFFVRCQDGSTIEFSSKKPVDPDGKLGEAMRDAVAAVFKIDRKHSTKGFSAKKAENTP